MIGHHCRTAAFAGALLALTVASHGSAQEGLGSKLISAPGVPTVWGATAEGRRDPEVKGGVAMRVNTTGAEGAAGVGVYVPIVKPVRKGDRLVIAYWARVAKGDAPMAVPYNAVQLAQAPFTAVFTGAATLTPKWEMHQVSGVAREDQATGTLNAAVQIGGGRRAIDFGPFYVLNVGQ